jgi:hypothetical protein
LSRRVRGAAALLIAATFSACTVVRHDGRRTLQWLDATATPSSPVARALLLPVAIPVGGVGLLADALVRNPAHAVDDAWADTSTLLWTSREESALRRALFTPLAAVATPVVFACDWLCRCILPLSPAAEGSR